LITVFWKLYTWKLLWTFLRNEGQHIADDQRAMKFYRNGMSGSEMNPHRI